MLTNKSDFLIGLAAGAIAGVAGYKLFESHKEQILNSFEILSSKLSKSDEVNLSEEELQTHKEHLEDLIAEQQAKNSK